MRGNWKMKTKILFRAWYYFRTGWATYFTFIMASVNTLVVTYYLAIEKIPSLKIIFPTFTNYVNVTPIDYANVQSDFQTFNLLLPSTLNVNDGIFDLILNDNNNIFFKNDPLLQFLKDQELLPFTKIKRVLGHK